MNLEPQRWRHLWNHLESQCWVWSKDQHQLWEVLSVEFAEMTITQFREMLLHQLEVEIER